MIKLIIFIYSLFQVTYAQFTCNPQLDCAAANVNDYVPDPQDCERYYICVDSEAGTVPYSISAPCPSGKYFDATYEYCIQESTPGSCNDNYCERTIAAECPTACPTLPYSVLVIYPGSCTNYYSCDPSGEVFVGNCLDPTPYFNGKMCDNDPNSCCNICMPPYCTTAGIHIPDPYSCRNFYICDKIGTADETLLFSCVVGQYFDSSKGKCVDGTTCQSFCSDEIISTATTLSTTSSSATISPLTSSSTMTSLSTTISTLKTSSTTSSSATISTSTASSTTTSSCITPGCPDTFECTYNGNFPRCSSCDRSYFHCSEGTATIWCCNPGLVFNTKPGYPYCIDVSLCPYL